MTRIQASEFCRKNLDLYGLNDWHIRLTMESGRPFLGLCVYKDKCIILNAFHIDTHPDPSVENTILHEIAHALTPGHGHDDVWRDKARELGCTSIGSCSHLSLSPEIIDAIRSGADVKVEYETEVIHHPKYTVTRLQDKCPQCRKVAKEVSSNVIESLNKKFIRLECGHLLVKDLPKQTPFHTLVSFGWKPEIANCKHEWNKNQCTKCGEYRPYEFQVDGMRFIEAAIAAFHGGGIFDEMGLGKTVQVMGYLKFHPEKCPALFIVKSGIKIQMFAESVRWLGTDYIGQVIQSSTDYLIPGLKTYFMSYDILTPKTRVRNGKTINQGLPLEKLDKLGIKTVILDECQQIKNPDSTRTQMIRRVVKNAETVIPLSGTPWKNRGSEFFTVLNMLAPTKFWSYQAFLNQWVDFYYQGNQLKQGGIKNPARFKEYVKDIVIRRERTEVMKELPLISRTLHHTQLDQTSQDVYDEQISDFVKWYNDKIIGGDDPFSSFGEGKPLIARLAEMRHTTGLAKIPATLEFVDEFVENTDRKLVVFVHHIDVGQILFDKLTAKYGSQMPVLKLTGGMSSENRYTIQQKFNESPRALLVASTLAAGEGLNLQTCSDCILHERQWNPANEEQAEGRFIRIGQIATSVTGTYMTASGTVDEKLAAIVERKRVDFHNAMNKGEMPVWKESDIIKELVDSIVNDWNKKNKKAS